jgi:hypothetical protein
MSEDATLKDVTVAPNPQDAAKPAEPTKPAAAEPEKIEVTDPAQADAAEIGRILLDSGYNKAQINDLMQAPRALASLRALLDSDPKQFVKQYALNNPEGASKLRTAVAEEYVELFGDKGGAKPAGKDGKGADSELMSEVSALRTEVAGYRTEREQANARAALAATQSRYNSRVDDMFGQDGIKKLGLTKSEQAGMRALLDKELASDTDTVKRVSNGNFVDVAPAFKRIIEGWAADKKAAADADKQARDGVKNAANFTFPGGPTPIEVPESAADSWEATEAALVKELERTATR